MRATESMCGPALLFTMSLSLIFRNSLDVYLFSCAIPANVPVLEQPVLLPTGRWKRQMVRLWHRPLIGTWNHSTCVLWNVTTANSRHMLTGTAELHYKYKVPLASESWFPGDDIVTRSCRAFVRLSEPCAGTKAQLKFMAYHVRGLKAVEREFRWRFRHNCSHQSWLGCSLLRSFVSVQTVTAMTSRPCRNCITHFIVAVFPWTHDESTGT